MTVLHFYFLRFAEDSDCEVKAKIKMWIKVRREQGELDEMAAMEAFRSVLKLPQVFLLLYSCMNYCCSCCFFLAEVVVVEEEEENEGLPLLKMMELGI